jgi:protein transport protein SEC9
MRVLTTSAEKLADTERHLDVAKAHTNRAEDATAELKALNRSIFRPVITFNKKGKREAEERRIEARHADEREEREKAMADVRDTQERIGRAATYGQVTEDQLLKKANRVRGDARKRYQFEANESDEELEDELDDNMNEIGDVAKRLKALALAQGQEVDKQNDRLTGLSSKTESLNVKIDRGTERLKNIK